MEVVVHPDKILKYLLVDPEKSRFFKRFGYSDQNWERLQSDLILLAQTNPSQLRQTTEYGEEYEIIGEITAPTGRTINIKSGWMVDAGKSDVIRFVTAYPA